MDITELLTTPDGAVLAAIGGEVAQNDSQGTQEARRRIETPKAYRNAPHACARARIAARKADLVAA